ncbi:MazG-like family protein [Streptococcus suis]
MTKTLDEKVQQWFIDRNLHEANPVKQFEKLMEEAGELFEGVAKGKSDLIKDALGDMQVVLTGLELQVKNGADIRATPEEMELLLMVASLGNLADRLHKHIYHNETMTPLIKPALIMLHSNIHSIAIHNCTTADTCLKIAYDEIKDRKGKMIDGVFVKEADLVQQQDSKFNYNDELQTIYSNIEELSKEHQFNPQEDEFTIVQPYNNGQAILIKAINEEERRIKVEISDTVFVLQQKQGTLDIYSGDEE